MPESPTASRPGFVARGGLWVLAQIPILAGAALLPWWLRGVDPDRGEPLVWLGSLLIIVGVAISILALVQLGEALTPYPHPRDGARLRRHGLYRHIRHPIYTGLMAASLGWALVWSSGAGMAYLAVVVVFFDCKAAREERWLRGHYPEYAAYQEQTRKFIPGVH